MPQDFIKSLDLSIEHLHVSVLQVDLAYKEIHKWRHPVDAEIAGIMTQIYNKIERLQRLKEFEAEKDENRITEL